MIYNNENHYDNNNYDDDDGVVDDDNNDNNDNDKNDGWISETCSDWCGKQWTCFTTISEFQKCGRP